MLDYPTETYEPILKEISSIIHDKNLFQNIQNLESPDSDFKPLSATILELIKNDPLYGAIKIDSLCDIPETIKEKIIKKADRILLKSDRSDRKCLANAFRVFNAFQFSDNSLLLAIKFLVFRIHYLLNANYLEINRRIKLLRDENTKLDKITDALVIQNNNSQIQSLIDENRYSASDLVILYAFYVCLTNYIKTAQSKCYDLIEGKKRYLLSNSLIQSIRNDLQESLQFNQSLTYGIDDRNKVTIEERPIPPLSTKEHKELSTEGKSARIFSSNCEFTNILYKQGFKRSGLFDGRYYHIDNESISGLHLSIQYSNETKDTAQYTKLLADQSLAHLRCMADGVAKNKASDEYIALNNGILKLDTDNPEQSQLLGFSPNLVVILPIQANYIENFSKDTDEYRKIDEYFDYISGKYEPEYSEHYQEIKTRIIESSSLVLSRSQVFKKFFYLHGPSNTGKTTYIDSFLGSLFDKNLYFSSKNLDDLDRTKHNFEIATLEHTALLLVDEGASKDSKASVLSKINLDNVGDCLKQILGGGMIEGAKKNIQQKSGFYPECRVYITSNHYIGFDDPQVLDKLVYVPLNIKVNKPECKCIFPDLNSQKMKDTLFMYLLTNGLYKVFDNYKNTGKYISDSPFIDSIQNKAKQGTSLYSAIADFIEDQNIQANLPFSNYSFINSSNMKYFTIKYYWDEYNSCSDNLKVSRKHFEDAFCEILSLHICTDQKVSGLPKKQISMLLPKRYATYGAYKKDCESQRILLNQKIAANTEKAYQEVLSLKTI